jgi:4-hydroxy-tetrahydrodipicolinate synthase
MSNKLDGLIPAIVIPFKNNFEIDEETLKQYVAKICQCDIKAIAVNTDAGEGNYLLQQEKERIICLVKEAAGNKLPVVCGLGGANITEVLKSARRFKSFGADYFLVFPQPFFKEGGKKLIVEYHKQIAKVGVPLIIFQLQKKLDGVPYDFDTLKELVKIKEVVAIKEASFDILKFKETVSFLKSLPKKITILTGNDNFILKSFSLGADGGLLGFGAVFTDIQVKAITLMKEKKEKEAYVFFAPIEDLCSFCFSKPIKNYRTRIKEVLVNQGIFKTSLVKPPLSSIGEQDKKAISNLLPKPA